MKLKPSGYQTAAISEQPGYLRKRFAAIRAKQKEAAESRKATVRELPRKVAK